MTLIARNDLTQDTPVSFTGKFGEEPTTLTFAKNPDAGGRYTAEVEDPIIIERLLSIPGYSQVTAKGRNVKTGSVESPKPLEKSVDPMNLGEARKHYRAVTGKTAPVKMTIAEMVEKIAEHNAGNLPMPGGDVADGGSEEETIGESGEIIPSEDQDPPQAIPKPAKD